MKRFLVDDWKKETKNNNNPSDHGAGLCSFCARFWRVYFALDWIVCGYFDVSSTMFGWSVDAVYVLLWLLLSVYLSYMVQVDPRRRVVWRLLASSDLCFEHWDFPLLLVGGWGCCELISLEFCGKSS